MTSVNSGTKFGHDTPRRSWWSRQSRLRKILLLLLLLLIILALALGLGLGLGLRGKGGGDEEEGPTRPPLPPLNGTVWQPKVGSSWQIVLKYPLDISSGVGSLSPNVDIYDIDLFTNDKSTIGALRKAGKRVICYFSAGSYEDWRPDKDEFQRSDYGHRLDEWPGEWWLDLTSENVMRIMKKRIDLAHSKGCDAIDPDNVDGYQNDNGLGLTADDSIDFIGKLAKYAASKSMSTGLKNAGDIIPQVLAVTHFSVNEQCAQYAECDTFAQYIKAGKPVFHIEYPDNSPRITSSQQSKYCNKGGDGVSIQSMHQFSTVLKNMNLDGFVKYCNGHVGHTPTKKAGSYDE